MFSFLHDCAILLILINIFSIQSTQSFPLTLKECDQNWDNCFDIYVKTFDKSYSNEQEYEYRFNIFLESLERISDMNKQSKGIATYGINEFSDMTPEEFKQTKLTNMPKLNKVSNLIEIEPLSEFLPTSFDWRNSTPPVITPVNNQLQCGSCWAESATETVESYWALSGNPLIQLSVQQSVDCCSQAYGCMGGWPSWAYESLIAEGGVESAEEYPYEGINERCRFNRSDIVATISNWATVTNTKNETLMTEWVAVNGPLSVCVDASSWMDYTTGIIWHGCGNWINHCVQIVGYGVSRRGIPYWTVRNSWGTDWGEDGYLKVYRGNDTCAIAQVVTTVIV